MTHCKFTETANQDLEKIIDYSLKQWGKNQTSKYLEELKLQTLSLSCNPDIGSICNYIYPGLLSFPIRKHVVYYIKDIKGITVIRILHANMSIRLHKFQSKK